jgi:hypothetical protein
MRPPPYRARSRSWRCLRDLRTGVHGAPETAPQLPPFRSCRRVSPFRIAVSNRSRDLSAARPRGLAAIPFSLRKFFATSNRLPVLSNKLLFLRMNSLFLIPCSFRGQPLFPPAAMRAVRPENAAIALSCLSSGDRRLDRALGRLEGPCVVGEIFCGVSLRIIEKLGTNQELALGRGARISSVNIMHLICSSPSVPTEFSGRIFFRLRRPSR